MSARPSHAACRIPRTPEGLTSSARRVHRYRLVGVGASEEVEKEEEEAAL
jgi:hypothetical protein